MSAAIPVGATTMKDLWVMLPRLLRNVVFPVPALPVRKMDADVLLMNRLAVVSTSVDVKFSMDILLANGG